MLSSQRITVEEGNQITFRLRTAEAVEERTGEAIFDINAHGNLIRGIEIISSFVDFPLKKAVEALGPVALISGTLPPDTPGTVTYEQDEVDGCEMVYINLLYDKNFLRLPPQEKASLLKVDHSIPNPFARFGLDRTGGLVYVKCPLADLEVMPETLLALLQK